MPVLAIASHIPSEEIGSGYFQETHPQELFRECSVYVEQVPDWVPLDLDTTVVASGVAEVALGTALVASPRRLRPAVGAVAAAFFIAVFPGNISQWANRRDGFGLDTDKKRFARLFFQPVLIAGRGGRRGSRATTPCGDPALEPGAPHSTGAGIMPRRRRDCQTLPTTGSAP
ncbi:hypothetical protein [Microbacterium aurum]